MAPTKRNQKAKLPTAKDEASSEIQAVNQEFEHLKQFIQSEQSRNMEKWNIQEKLLSNTLRKVDAIRRNEARTRAKAKKQEAWDNIFLCDGIPRSFRPKSILRYLSQLQWQLNEKLKPECDWSLERDELSVLTQDISVPDRTFKTLKLARPKKAEDILAKITQIETVIRGVQRAIERESTQLSDNEKLMLHQFRTELQTAMMKCFDVYCFHIFRSMETNLEPVEVPIEIPEEISNLPSRRKSVVPPKQTMIDATCLQKSYSTENLSINLWALRNVPQPRRTQRDYFTLCLDKFGGEVSIPYCSAIEALTFRAYWVNCDNYSVHCPTYAISNQPAPIIDLLQSIAQEWNERTRIEEQKLILLETKKTEFANNILAWAEREQQMQNEKTTTSGKKANVTKAKKQPRSPKKRAPKLAKFSFGDEREYDSKAQYVSLEDANYIKQVSDMFPNSRTLRPGDLNLRDHQLIGGTFHVEFRPKQSTRREFCLTNKAQFQTIPADRINFQCIELDEPMKDDNGANDKTQRPRQSSRLIDLLPDEMTQTRPRSSARSQPTRKSLLDVIKDDNRKRSALIIPTPGPSEKPRERQRLSRLLSENEFGGYFSREAEKKPRIQLSSKNHLIASFKIKLPPNLIWWTPPTVCYWEPWEYSEEFENLSKENQKIHRNYKNHLEELHNSLSRARPNENPADIVIDDFDMQKFPKNVHVEDICRKIILPALPYHYKTFAEVIMDRKLEDEIRRKERIEAGISTPLEEEPFKVRNVKSHIRAESTPPSPLFILRDPQPNVTILTADQLSNIVVFDNDGIPEASRKLLKQRDIDYGNEEEYRPPNIRFSDYYNSIKNEASIEDSMISRLFDSDKMFRIKMNSNDLGVTLSSNTFRKATNRRRSKRSRVNRSSSLTESKLTEQSTSTEGSPPQKATGTAEKVQLVDPMQRPRGRWCTRNIEDQEYNAGTQTITFKSPCFGAYGLAIPRYQHMPFKSWLLTPHTGKFQHITLHLQTRFIPLEIHVSSKGFSIHVPPKIPKPENLPHNMLPLYEFKRILCEKGLNIFAARDIACYINGISEKHISAEYHTYYSMAYYCLTHRFKHSPWNRLAPRRNMLFSVQDIGKNLMVETSNDFYDVLVTPDECTRVRVNEECGGQLSDVSLKYQPYPEGQEYHPDLFYLLNWSLTDPSKDIDEETSNLIFNVAQLLAMIRPLSLT